MSAGSLYGWGCLGGAVAAVFIYAAPALIQAAIWGEMENMTPKRALYILGTVILLAAIAGVVPLIPDGVDTRGEAIAYGLAAQTILKGLIAGGKEAIRPPGNLF